MAEYTLTTADSICPIIVEPGLITRLGKYLSELLPKAKAIAILSDETVANYYLAPVKTSLEDAGLLCYPIIVADGETSKSLAVAEEVYTCLSQSGLSKTDAILSLGGGVVGDLSGFVASTYLRGIPCIQVPTSLTAQVDAAIGGKTALNLPTAKNSIGTITQPVAVLIDPSVLITLSDRDLYEGMGEVVKYGLLADTDLFDRLLRFSQTNTNARDFILSTSDILISKSIAIKTAIVSKDEQDTGLRHLLNFGHTYGHAYEIISKGGLRHGEAVGLGILAILRLSEREGWLDDRSLYGKTKKILEKLHLPTHIKSDPDACYQAICHDKKRSGDTISLAIISNIGCARVIEVGLETLKQ